MVKCVIPSHEYLTSEPGHRPVGHPFSSWPRPAWSARNRRSLARLSSFSFPFSSSYLFCACSLRRAVSFTTLRVTQSANRPSPVLQLSALGRLSIMDQSAEKGVPYEERYASGPESPGENEHQLAQEDLRRGARVNEATEMFGDVQTAEEYGYVARGYVLGTSTGILKGYADIFCKD